MLLSNKNAVIYGAAGSIGQLVAEFFAIEGATVHLCGRNSDNITAVADRLVAKGSVATSYHA